MKKILVILGCFLTSAAFAVEGTPEELQCGPISDKKEGSVPVVHTGKKVGATADVLVAPAPATGGPGGKTKP